MQPIWPEGSPKIPTALIRSITTWWSSRKLPRRRTYPKRGRWSERPCSWCPIVWRFALRKRAHQTVCKQSETLAQRLGHRRIIILSQGRTEHIAAHRFLAGAGVENSPVRFDACLATPMHGKLHHIDVDLDDGAARAIDARVGDQQVAAAALEVAGQSLRDQIGQGRSPSLMLLDDDVVRGGGEHHFGPVHH